MMTIKRLLKIVLLLAAVYVFSLPLLVLAYTPVAVYGQADYTSSTPNRGGQASAETFFTPLGLTLDAEGGLYVADRDNHRVLYFANDGNQAADRVDGQHGDLAAHIANNDGSGNSGRASADSLNMPTAVALDSAGGLYVTDRDNHRVLYFANDGNTTADRVYGQFGNFNTNMTNNDSTANYGDPSADNFGTYILGIAVDGGDGLYVSDSSNHRVLYFANDGNTTADRVYGQWDSLTMGVRNNDGTGRMGTPSANSLNFPRGLAIDSNDALYVADRDNNRVLHFYNDGDTTADRVYGQFGDFTTNVESNDGTGNVGIASADNLSHPKALAVGPAGGLYVTDAFHHRVLWFANDNDTTADGSAGQFMSMASGVANNDGSGGSGAAAADNLNEPQGIVVAPDGRIFVADSRNHRVLMIDCPEWE
jgi:NHL repeat